MSLDKWLKSEDREKKTKKNKESEVQEEKQKSGKPQKKVLEKPSTNLIKYMLICTNTNCKYQKIVMKRHLNDIDKKCPRCNKKMRIKGE